MKVYLPSPPESGSDGMYQVQVGLHKHLPKHVELVNNMDKADVVHVQISNPPNIDKPLVLSNHGLYWTGEQDWGKFGYHMNVDCITGALAADVVTAPSQFIRNALARHLSINPVVCHHGIDLSEWQALDNEGYVLWNKSRHDAACDSNVVQELAKLLPSTQFVSTFGLDSNNLFVIGRVPPEEMKQYVAKAGVYLDTAKESGGPCFGVLEALACGVPVVSFNYGGTAEVITHGETGYLAHNLDDLAAGITYCLEHRARLSANCLELVKNYNWDKVIPDYLKAYDLAIKRYAHTTKVSVILPVYNLGEFVDRAIQSVIHQSSKDWELIIVDDHSLDNSAEVVDRYKDQPNVKIIHLPKNVHVSEARNTGIRAATGKYILPLDADDALLPTAIEMMIKELDQDRSLHIVAGKMKVHQGEKVFISGWPSTTSWEEQLKGKNQIPYASMYRRGVWEDVGGYRKRIRNGVEDADFWTRAFSFGRKAKLIDKPTLEYYIREDSLSNANRASTDYWLGWFPWSTDAKLLPGAISDNMISLNPPDVSVIIPVGAGHEYLLQTALDSLLAQTFWNWEAVVINDSGRQLETPSWARVVVSDRRSPAGARNIGLAHAKAPLVVFLDADDILQPTALEALFKAYQKVGGGWIYGDWWYVGGDGQRVYSQAKDWSVEEMSLKSICPITGIYNKSDILSVGGFDETVPGWEDWDLHLKLLKACICGTRVEHPIMTYHMDLGSKREKDFANRQEVFDFIKNRYNLGEGLVMGCSSCNKGGRATLSVQNIQQVQPALMTNDAMVTLEYVGTNLGKTRIRSKVKGYERLQYTFSAGEPQFQVLADDAKWLIMRGDIKQAVAKVPEVRVQQSAIVLEAAVPASPVTPLDVLDLRTEIITLLKREFSSVEELKSAPDSRLLAISGIGSGRLNKIREVSNAV